MQVRVLYFGVLQERLGAAEETIDLGNGATVGELVRVLRERPSNSAMSKELARVWQSLAVAVNREYSYADTVLHEGDEVALLPPVSGGRFAPGDRRVSRAVADGAVVARAMLAAEFAS